ncbi:valyl-tRNA synthetase [Rubritalea squalenifaciens DSM 18772]|uniref:Valine--tRNA ligase n=1 Tax=Rubritalea squalenifaciens DSM 18772 TaxID=1123071 RepID=A0A1M6I5S4_9BACT|nr:valine--tRNA ligase [Rubritalea squalenifaciens]SHJ29778.1 valyl-tRNA synthetase [Rubritalea squalenifaciens DSM 18772]
MSELPKAYEPQEVEINWYQKWLENKCFSADVNSSKEAYSIVIPPPNVTGILHLGHVLNNSIQDILARRARQQGKEVLWLPGTDHAGIATQTKVEKKVREEENTTRRELGREEFLKRVWDWKDKHGGIIIKQLKRLGCSCDWDRERFTMDEDYSEWVSKVFVDLFNEGLIYRGKRMVNWCPVSLTALSDEEVIPKPQRSKLYFMKYELVDSPGEFLEISTTRPETLMGDIAVAVNPKDERFAKYVGKNVRRPFPEAEIPVIADDHVDIEFGTGALKITPAHDKADFEIGERHNLEIIDILHPDGRINCPEVPELDGLDRFVARKKAAAKLEEMGLLIKVEEHENNVGYSERADVPIEPRISMQWFLKYPAVQEATDAVANGDITFRPERWNKIYAHWMNNLQDWCISRQLWWGHQIPVWYRKDKAFDLKEAESLDVKDTESGDIYVGTEPPADGDNWVRDEDVMDTWFSSWLWPFATMDEQTRAKFYPTTDLVTGPDIIFFWVARMIMAGYRFEGELPFKNVFFTSIIRDIQGRKMSKSLGNSPDPIDLMEKYGADGLRFGLMRIAPIGSDVKFDETMIEEGRNFANKLYNACRFRQMQGGEAADLVIDESLPVYHLDILAKLDELDEKLEKAYASYRFNDVTQHLYEFFWTEYCDKFLESAKFDFRSGDDAAKQKTLGVIDLVLSKYLAHLHPFMPHITEELSAKMGYVAEGEFLMTKALDHSNVLDGVSAEAITRAKEITAAVHETAGRLRNLKAEYQLAASKDVVFVIKPVADWVAAECDTLALLVGAKEMQLQADFDAPKGTPASVTPIGEVYMPLEGLIDMDAEKARLDKEIDKIAKEVEKSSKKLSNENFVARAKPEVVAVERERLQEWEAKLAQLKEMRLALA